MLGRESGPPRSAAAIMLEAQAQELDGAVMKIVVSGMAAFRCGITVALIAETVAANVVDGRISDAVLDTIEPDGPLKRDVRGLRVTLMGTWIETSAARLA